MQNQNNGSRLLGLAAAALLATACAHQSATGPDPADASAPDLADSGGAPAATTALPSFGDGEVAPPWARYRTALYLPDPDHRTLESEIVPPNAAPDPALGGDDGDAQEPTAAPTDLWDRIRAGYGFPEQANPRVESELAWYVRHPDYIARTVERARPYLHLIVEALEERGMPLEIAFLPIVESAFQPFAYSHGRAAGLWQFVPGTAKRYGLKQNWWYDGRRDVVASTRAALDYLEYLHGFFDGDWMLALAAYNSGEGTVRRAVKRNLAQGLEADFWSLNLPRETRAYVPKLIALCEIFARPDDYGIALESIPDAPAVALVETGSQIDLARAAELARIELEELYRLNPGFNRWATDPDGPHELLLPVASVETFRTALAELDDEHRMTWTRHLIAEGETLGHIAQRYGTTVPVLREVNGIRGHMIRAGRSLLIPVAMRNPGTYALSADQRRAATQSTARGAERSVHVVRPGDTLWDIARKHRVGVRQLAEWNAMAPGDLLRPGQRLVIWAGTRTASADGDLLNTAHPMAGVTQRISYVVRKGDSLSRISQRFNVKVSELLRWNSLAAEDYLQPGQRLTLFIDVTRQTANL